MELINDIKEYVEKAVSGLKADPKLMEQFKEEPVKAIEKVLKVDLPDEKLKPIADAVKAKLAGDKLGQAADTLKGLFKK